MIEQVELTIRQPGHPDRVVRLPEGTTRLGRAEDNDVVLSDVGVSRRHARVLVSRDKVRIEDLGSGNGTYYRGFRVQTQVLQDADEVVIDPFILTFRIRGDVPVDDEDDLDTASAPARLDVIVGTGMSRMSYPIGARGLTIGRSENRDVVVPDPAASRHHCTIIPRNQDFVLRDMGSANGVFVNSVRVREAVLASGDRIRIGNTELRFVVNEQPWLSSAGRHAPLEPISSDRYGPSLSLPAPRRRGMGRWIGALVGLLAIVGLVAVIAAIGGGLALWWWGPFDPVMPPSDPSPPAWTLRLPGGLPEASVSDLFEQGIASMRERENREALESFYRALAADPGNEAAERLAFVAGEFVLLDAVEEDLVEEAAGIEAREAHRDDLLAQVRRGGRRGRAAGAELTRDFADDPVVVEALGLEPPPEHLELEALMEEASSLEADEAWAEAAATYREVLGRAEEPDLRRKAAARARITRRELAIQVALDWRTGVVHEAWGRDAQARQAYQEVLAVDPANPSVRLRVQRLEQAGP